jgi:DNA-binding transcriptional ArsR family regulator
MKETIDFHSFELELSQMAKCLAHPARIQIISILSKHKDRTVKKL